MGMTVWDFFSLSEVWSLYFILFFSLNWVGSCMPMRNRNFCCSVFQCLHSRCTKGNKRCNERCKETKANTSGIFWILSRFILLSNRVVCRLLRLSIRDEFPILFFENARIGNYPSIWNVYLTFQNCLCGKLYSHSTSIEDDMIQFEGGWHSFGKMWPSPQTRRRHLWCESLILVGSFNTMESWRQLAAVTLNVSSRHDSTWVPSARKIFLKFLFIGAFARR